MQSVERATETMDRSLAQAYSDLAESIYAAFNSAVVEAGLAELPLPQQTKFRAERSLVVVEQCRKDMRLSYHDAVADAYVELRKMTHLPTALPAR